MLDLWVEINHYPAIWEQHMNKGELKMNTKQILIAMAVVAAMSATVVMAQDASAPAPAAPAATAPATQSSSGHKGRHEMKFADRKAHALKRLEKQAATVQQKQACVQASTDKESLQACFPKRGQGKGKGGWHKHGAKGGADNADTGAAAPDAAPASK
jgi:hypothetical protein